MAAPTNPKITQIVDQISQLTLLETADLVSSLKVGQLMLFLPLECSLMFRFPFIPHFFAHV